MRRTIISDTGCLILLDNINELQILNKIFGTITTTKEVSDEFGKPLPSWIILRQPIDSNSQLLFELNVDKGEASAMALAVEEKDSLLIIDDLKGRKLAKQLGLTIIGTLGIIVDAKLKGIITSVKPILDKIDKTNFRISTELQRIIIERSGE